VLFDITPGIYGPTTSNPTIDNLDTPHPNYPRVVAYMFVSLESPALHDDGTTTRHVETVLNPFIEQYREGNTHFASVIEQQITWSTRCGEYFEVHPPAHDDTIDDISSELLKKCPTV